MKKMVTGEVFVVALMSILALSVSALPWVIRIANIPPGREFIPIHNSLDDYPFYVSVIRQGLDGSRSVVDRFAIEPHGGSVVHFFYLLLGWVGALVGIKSAHVVYHLSRFILGGFWCMAIYWLLETVIKEKWIRIVAFFFILFSASFPRFLVVHGQLTTSWFMTWWSEFDPTIRVAFVPHFMVGHIMMVAAMVSLLHYQAKPETKWLIRGGLSSWFAAFVHPPSFIVLLFVLPLYGAYLRKRQWVIGSLIVLVTGVLGLVLIDRISWVFPWNLPKLKEGISFAVPVTQYILALGPVVVLAFIGMVAQRRVKETWFFVLWVVVSIAMIPISKAMPLSPIAFIRQHAISNIRFLQTAVWVPLGILGAYGLASIWKHSRVACVACIALLLFLTFVGYPATIKEQADHIYFSREYTYPKKGYLEGIVAIARVAPPEGNILSLSLGGMTIPMYSNRTVYVGQVVYTPDREAKMARSWQFYAGVMKPCEAYTFLKANHIAAVLYSFDEKNVGGTIKFYPFLQPWNTYGETTVYTFVDSPPPDCALR